MPSPSPSYRGSGSAAASPISYVSAPPGFAAWTTSSAEAIPTASTLGSTRPPSVCCGRAPTPSKPAAICCRCWPSRPSKRGWAAFDAGHHDDARGLYEDSHHAATTAGDHVLAANALAFLAYQERDPHAAVHIALQSCHTAGPDAPPSTRALLHERRAWAHALAGEAGETERALDAAVSALAERADDPQPDWAAWVDHTELGIMTGRCWAELGRPLRAVPILEQALAGFDDAHARDKALYMTWLASAYVSAGEVEQAAATATRVLTLSEGVASVRPRQKLAPVLDKLAHHRALPEVADVLELARTR